MLIQNDKDSQSTNDNGKVKTKEYSNSNSNDYAINKARNDPKNCIDNPKCTEKQVIKTEKITITKTKDIDYLQFNKLLEFEDKITHAMTLKNHDVGFKRSSMLINNSREASYLKLEDEFSINIKDIIQPYQEHTDNIFLFKDINTLGNDLYSTKLENMDGIICNIPEIASLTTSADCTPIIIYDPVNNVYANVHSGWKGTVKKIAQKAVIKLIKDYDCNPRNLICCIGPCIRKECFLVNDDVANIYKNEFQEYCENYNVVEETDLFNENGQQYRIDNSLVIKLMLEDINIPEENIIDSNICTVCSSHAYHSRRAEGKKFQTNGCLTILK